MKFGELVFGDLGFGDMGLNSQYKSVCTSERSSYSATQPIDSASPSTARNSCRLAMNNHNLIISGTLCGFHTYVGADMGFVRGGVGAQRACFVGISM